jgi:Tfp pilus assembly protein PilF
MPLIIITRLPAILLVVAATASAQVGKYEDKRCWREPELDEVTAVLGPASAEERLGRSAHALAENSLAGHWHYQAYLAYRALGSLAEAESELREALRNDADNPRYYGALAEFYYHQGDWVLALDAAREHAKLESRNPVSRCLLARLYEMADDLDAARKEYRACKAAATKLPSPSCKAQTSYGRVSMLNSNPGDSYFPSRRWDRRLPYRKSIGPSLHLLSPLFEGPCNIGMYLPDFFQLAEDEQIFVGGLGNYAHSAIKRLDGRGSRKPPGGPMSKVSSDELPWPFDLKCPDKKQLLAILESAKDGLTRKENPVWAYWRAQAAWGHFALGNITEALNNIKAGLEADPENLLLYLAGARIASSTGDLESAHKFLVKAYRLAPDNPWVHFRLGELLERKGNVLEARQYYTSCLEKLGVPEEVVFTDDWKEVRGTPSLGEEAEKRLKALGGGQLTRGRE